MSINELAPRKTGTATLTIDNFSQLISDTHVPFKINERGCFYFGLRPKTVMHSREYSSIYLFNYSQVKSFNFHLKASILNVNGDKVYIKKYDGAFSEQDKEFSAMFIPRFQIVPEKGYLHRDKLTLLCEIEMFEHGQAVENVNPLASIFAFQKQDLNNLSVDLQSLLNDGKFSDVALVVGTDGKELRVHRNILATRSSVFAAMFEHDCEEMRLNKVTITDIDGDACEELVRYIYTGKVQSIDRFAVDLLEAADKYQVDSLKCLCEQYLSANLSIETAANVFILADMHRANVLKSKCIDYISDNAKEVYVSVGWKLLSSSKPQLLSELFIHLANKKTI